MNWEITGATGEWAGAVAVVLTLFYLARQIHQNTQATKTGASYSFNDSLSKQLGAVRDDGDFADIWLRGGIDFHWNTLPIVGPMFSVVNLKERVE